jgi:hypothetical protein
MFGAIYAKCNGVKRQMAIGMKKRNSQQLGSQQIQMAHKERIATNADTMWNLGLMAASGICVPNKNTDKGNRR